ncbi:MAG: hypothetical protein J7L26_00440 [Candidatus Aminicenantes bacterium]|nr:hypothetical protein [Candidatus Aminicenantes bacterium]
MELYNDAAVYIGTREIKCPVCGRYTPLVGNWWLSKVKGGQYAYMRPKVVDDRVEIEIVEGEKRGTPESNVRGRPQHVRCLLCGTNITTHNGEFYPKIALRDWNRKLEEYLNGRISLDDLKNSLARPRILVKVYIENKN